jgi:hypothetical protein
MGEKDGMITSVDTEGGEEAIGRLINNNSRPKKENSPTGAIL